MELIAKKYIKALVSVSSAEELKKYASHLSSLSALYSDEKAKAILLSSEIKNDKKEELLLAGLGKTEQKFQNFIKVLALKGRLELIPLVSKVLNAEMAKMENRFQATVYSQSNLSKANITNLEKSLSARVGAKVDLEQSKEKYDGLKVSVDGLGLEVSFSKHRVKTQLIEHILKAI